MSKPSRRPGRRNRHHRQDVPDWPWRVLLIGQHVGQHCTGQDCKHDHKPLPPGVEPFADFAYTVGLYDLFDSPEIHLPAYPEIHLPAYPDGDGTPLKPGPLGGMVNALAASLVKGFVRPGGEQRVPLCEHQTLVLTLGQPGPPDEVSAFQCSDGAECVPVRWRLEGGHA